MTKRILSLLFIFLATFVFAEEDPADLLDLQASQEKILDQRENYFRTSTDYALHPNVNPITGELNEEEVDLVVAGCQPLSIRRFYNHFSPYDARYASWRYNPESFLAANLEWKEQATFAAIGDIDGSVLSLNRSNNDYYLFNFEVSKSFSSFQSDGKTHPLNTHMHYWKIHDPKDKHRFQYIVTITDGSGRTREFATSRHRWTHNVRWREKASSWYGYSERNCLIRPNTWTPYHIPITEEKLPNGNVLVYSYTLWKEEEQNFPYPQLLSSITAYNHDKTKILGSIKLHYPRKKHDHVAGIEIFGSDGRQAFIQHTLKAPTLLWAARRPDQPSIDYGFENERINRVERPDGRVLTTDYNAEGKVSAQYAPVGPKGEMHPIGRYIYHPQATEVYDAENHKTIYRFNEDKKLLTVEIYQNETLYRIERFTWDPSNGNLLKKTIEDNQGTPHQITEYLYDKNHNPIEEKIGDGRQWHTIFRTFSDDGFNLKLTESDRPGRVIHYHYLPQTNLLSAELLYEENTLRKRIFHFYDDCATCIKTIQDDGSTEDPYNLQRVTCRIIKEMTPKSTIPCMGLPEIVEEKTINSQGHEILLKKIVYTYTSFGKVAKEDHYDANQVYRYSILNQYDSQERLISKIDPLGNETTFTYDRNNNLTSIAGPRKDQYKEIAYDKANRPIRIADWQTDGSILITEKQYNKLGQVIADIDACGNTTRFQYDSLGRCISTIHPDGAMEQKEYNLLGHLIKEKDPLGYETHKIYNYKGQPLAIHYPDGSEEKFTYFSHGPTATHIDKNGAQTIYTLDIFDHPIKIEIHSSLGKPLKTTTAQYSPFHKISETDGKGTTTFYTYDFAGRKIAEQKDIEKRLFTYDPLGRLEKTQQGETTYIENHDLLGQLLEKRTEKNGILQFQEKYTYDSAGNTIQTINSQGIHETTYTTYGKPLSSKDPLGHTTYFNDLYKTTLTETITNPHHIQTIHIHDIRGRKAQYLKKNARGQTIQQTQNIFDQAGNLSQVTHTLFDGTNSTQTITHNWEYGPMGRIERLIEAGIKQSQYLYDPKGRLQTLIKPDGVHLHYEYDDLGRVSRYSSHDFDYHYEYDPNDCLLSIYDTISKKKTTRLYNPLGHIIQETLANNLTLSITFDNQSRKTSLTLPNSSTATYTYDGPYLQTVTYKGNTYTYSERNLEGLLLKVTLPKNLGELTFTRDPLGRCTTFTSPFYSSELRYDAVGNLIQLKSQDIRNYQFDDLDQLINEQEHTYQFDSLHNRLKKDTLPYIVNSLCQIIHDGHNTYTFDPNGNLVSDGARKFTYDSQDRLITIEENDKRIEYEYDPLHRRLSKTLFIQNRKIKHDRYLWDGDNEIGMVDEKGNIQELRILGEGISAEIGSAVLYELQGKSYLPIHDHQGSLITLIDLSSRKPIGNYRYTAFGEELTSNTLSPWRFSSKRTEETDLIFFGRRYYNPKLGRFMTQDPEGFEHGPNLYAYVNNSPLTHFDPYGLFSVLSAPTLNFNRHFLFDDFEKSFWNKSCSYDLSILRKQELPEGMMFFGNGMLNSLGEASKSLNYISDLGGGYNINGLYNATHGAFIDIQEAYWGLLGCKTNPVDLFKNEWKNKLDQLPLDQFALHFCHSQSAIHTKLALQESPEEIRKRIRVVAVAPAAYIPDDICHSVQHYEAHLWRDPIPWCNPISRWKNRHTIKVLPSHPNAPWHDHSITSPTFEKVIRDEINYYRKILGK